jgi:hypothetical protein
VGEAAPETAIPESRTFDKGLIFVKDTNILLSGDKWTIVVNIAVDDYTALVYIMRASLNQIQQKRRLYKNPKLNSFDIHWDELNRLDIMVQGLEDDLLSFRKL